MSDPMTGLRRIFAGVLIMEAIVVALGLLVVANLEAGVGSVAGWYTIGLVLAMLVGSGLQRTGYGLPIALALQLAMILGVFATPALGVMGVIFALVWAYLLWARRRVMAVHSGPASGDP